MGSTTTTMIKQHSDAGSDGQKIGQSATDKLGFFGATPVARPTITGEREANQALASLLTALANLGIVVDGTTEGS